MDAPPRVLPLSLPAWSRHPVMVAHQCGSIVSAGEAPWRKGSAEANSGKACPRSRMFRLASVSIGCPIEENSMGDTAELRVGLKGSAELVVGEEHTAPKVGSGRVHVLATPVMINLIEAAALAAVEHLLPEGYQSLGTHLDVRHIAATPVGMKVRATAVVAGFSKRTISFK